MDLQNPILIPCSPILRDYWGWSRIPQVSANAFGGELALTLRQYGPRKTGWICKVLPWKMTKMASLSMYSKQNRFVCINKLGKKPGIAEHLEYPLAGLFLLWWTIKTIIISDTNQIVMISSVSLKINGPFLDGVMRMNRIGWFNSWSVMKR